MKFQVYLRHLRQEPFLTEASSWFLALKQTMQECGEKIQLNQLLFSLYEDQESAEVVEQETGRTFHVIRISHDGVQNSLDTSPSPIANGDSANITLGDLPPRPLDPSNDTFSVDGPYVPGATVDLLTNMFMKMDGLNEHFGTNRLVAFQYILKLLLECIKAVGGALLIADLNSANSSLKTELAIGEGSDWMQGQTFLLGKGLIGHCVQHGNLCNVSEFGDGQMYPDDPLAFIPIHLGPCVCSPIQLNNRLFGAIFLYRLTRHPEFLNGEENMISYVAERTAAYLAILET